MHARSDQIILSKTMLRPPCTALKHWGVRLPDLAHDCSVIQDTSFVCQYLTTFMKRCFVGRLFCNLCNRGSIWHSLACSQLTRFPRRWRSLALPKVTAVVLRTTSLKGCKHPHMCQKLRRRIKVSTTRWDQALPTPARGAHYQRTRSRRGAGL